jgi:uncharacterized protein YbjT (DUF2867 family)
MSTQEKQIVLVFGATGKQGGAVINCLLKNKQYHIRGISRKKHQNKVAKLQNLGIEMVKADIATGEGLDEAFKGVYAAYIVTNSFDQDIERRECEYAKRLVEKACANGVKILVWSSAPDAESHAGGKYEVPQFTEKAKVEQFILDLHCEKNAFQNVIFITPTFYYQNFMFPGYAPKRDERGNFVFRLPDVKNLMGCDVNDLGLIFCKILQDPAPFNKKNILVNGNQANIEDYVETFRTVTKQPVNFQPIKPEELEKCPDLHHGKQLSHMFNYLNEYPHWNPSPNVIQARQIVPEIKSWGQWLQETGWRGELNP